MTAGDVYRALWRHRIFIAVLTTVAVVATWLATASQTKTYEASALVRIQQRIGDPSEALGALEAGQRLAETYSRIIDSGALDAQVSKVASRSSGGNVGTVDLSGEPVQDLELLWVSARDEDPAKAALVANAVAPALRSFIATTGTLRDQVVTIKPATRPSSPASPNLSLNIAIAFLLALMFNCALALLYELLRDRLPETEELSESVGYPVLATIPPLRLRELKTAQAGRGRKFGRSQAAGTEAVEVQATDGGDRERVGPFGR